MTFPGNNVVIQDLDLVPTSAPLPLPPPGSPSGIPADFPATSFFDVFVEISLDGGAHFAPMTGTAQMNETANLPTISSPTETFDTMMTGLDITGSTGGHSVELNLDPSHTDPGNTTVTAMGGGQFQIQSFFDIFTELSLDHGAFVPQSGGPSLLVLNSAPDAGSTLLLLLSAVALIVPMQRFTSRKSDKGRPTPQVL